MSQAAQASAVDAALARTPSPPLRLLGPVNLLTAFGGVLLLVLSVWPGFVVGCFLVLAYPLIGLLGLAWCAVVFRRVVAGGPPLSRRDVRRVLVAPLMVCVTYAALRFYIPRRVAFAVVCPEFARHVAAAPVSESGVPLDRRLGIYRVDEYATDARGGTYFRTGYTADGIGPDRLSYGFAHRPNGAGSPFGAARYRVWRLSRDWYWFRASDDF